MSVFRRLITEAHRRSVWQVLGIYLGGAWVAFQVVQALTENAGLPAWFPALALALLVLGLPVVVATAFVQEGPPRMGEETQAGGEIGAPSSAASPESASARVFTWRNAMLGGAAAFSLWGVVAAAWLLMGAGPTPLTGAEDERPTIAVLPFDNLSGDAENAYFADGVHEELLTRLASIEALRVISRTSVMEYRDTDRNIRTIAAELGVGAILEGSVRRAGNRVRITAQLIDADTDEHLWAESYDRDLADIFAIQADVAEKIAAALNARLAPAERRSLEERPTEDLEAYDYYLRALEIDQRGGQPDNVAASQQLYERAVQRDADFVAARARLVWSHLLTYWLGYDRSPARVDVARAHVAHLQRIAPDAPETHYALGFLRYYGDYDFAGAAREFELALGGAPHLARPGLAYVQRRMGMWEEHIRNMELSRRASPRDQDLPRNLAETYAILGRFDEADRTYDEAIELSPTSADAYYQKISAMIAAGRIERADETAALARSLALTDPDLSESFFWLEYMRGDASAAMRTLEGVPNDVVISQLSYTPTALLRGYLFDAYGGNADAQYQDALRQLEPASAARPWDPRVWLALGNAYAGLGRAADAHAAMRRVNELFPVERDEVLGPDIMRHFARIHVFLGEHDDAIAVLQRVRTKPSRLTDFLLENDPVWAPLRSDPRFQALLN